MIEEWDAEGVIAGDPPRWHARTVDAVGRDVTYRLYVPLEVHVVDDDLAASMRAAGFDYEEHSDGFVKMVQGRGAPRRLWLDAAAARESFRAAISKRKAKKAA